MKPLDILHTKNQNIKLSTEPCAGLHNTNGSALYQMQNAKPKLIASTSKRLHEAA